MCMYTYNKDAQNKNVHGRKCDMDNICTDTTLQDQDNFFLPSNNVYIWLFQLSPILLLYNI